jgi:hypothetical protein
MNHIGERIPILLALSNHPLNIIPGVTVILHGLDDFDDGIDIRNVLFDVLGF